MIQVKSLCMQNRFETFFVFIEKNELQNLCLLIVLQRWQIASLIALTKPDSLTNLFQISTDNLI